MAPKIFATAVFDLDQHASLWEYFTKAKGNLAIAEFLRQCVTCHQAIEENFGPWEAVVDELYKARTRKEEKLQEMLDLLYAIRADNLAIQRVLTHPVKGGPVLDP